MAENFVEISYDVADNIGTITLNQPERRNTFTTGMCAEILAACDLVDSDDGVRAVILTAAGRTFCAGADLSLGASTFDHDEESEGAPDRTYLSDRGTFGGVPRDGGGLVSLRFASLRKPIIAAINGAAVGIGVTMTLPADIRIAAASARFGFVFTRRGLVPEAASSWFLPRVVGISQAMEWVATGRIFDSGEALRGGLVSRVVPDGEVVATARQIATEIVENTSAVAVSLARHMLWSMLSSTTPWDAHHLDSQLIYHLGKRPDVTEGVSAFLEKRPASFPMRVTSDFPDFVGTWPEDPGLLD